ncbi:MAG: helical backbone metal receptor [Pseudomonadota bacterium]
MTYRILGLGAFIAAVLALIPGATAQERVVSVGGDLTEIIYALGEGKRLVATDSTSVYPPIALTTPKVGYVRNLSAEGVLSVEPDLILLSGAAGPAEALEQLRATGVPIVEMETEYTIEAILEKTRRVSQALGVPEKGATLAATIEADWGEAQAEIAKLKTKPSVLFFSTVRDGTPTAAGRETAAQGVINLMGGKNVFDQRTGYKPISFEATVAADPDIILVMNHVAARIGGLQKVIDHPAIALTTAAQNGRVFIIDAVTVMQFSPRTPKAVGSLAREIDERLSAVDAG